MEFTIVMRAFRVNNIMYYVLIFCNLTILFLLYFNVRHIPHCISHIQCQDFFYFKTYRTLLRDTNILSFN